VNIPRGIGASYNLTASDSLREGKDWRRSGICARQDRGLSYLALLLTRYILSKIKTFHQSSKVDFQAPWPNGKALLSG
jgi:hypothetical protein